MKMSSQIFFILLLSLNLVLGSKPNPRKGHSKNQSKSYVKSQGRTGFIFDGIQNAIKVGAEILKFPDFKTIFERKYPNKSEERTRKEVFEKNRNLVQKHNKMADKGLFSFRLILNKFADRSLKDLQIIFGNFDNKDISSTGQVYNRDGSQTNQLPETVDLRDKGFVTDVQDQTFACFASWAFATTGALEGHYFRKSKRLVPLSEQFLIDCGVNGEDGCSEGSTAQAFKFVKEYGTQNEVDYPYLGDCSDCPYKLKRIQNPTKSYISIKKGDEQAMKEVVANIGPIAVTIRSQVSFILFKGGGIYSEPNCSDDMFKHYVLIVGYGTEQDKDYWLVKNNLGIDWGERGYFKIARNVNMCGIADFPMYPIV